MLFCMLKFIFGKIYRLAKVLYLLRLDMEKKSEAKEQNI